MLPRTVRPRSPPRKKKVRPVRVSSATPRSDVVIHPGQEIFATVFRALKPRTALPEFVVRFHAYADVNNVIRIRDGKVVAGLSDLLEAAPPTVLESIAYILLCKLYRKPIPKRYHGGTSATASTLSAACEAASGSASRPARIFIWRTSSTS
jgi:hypothetical protein